MSSKHRNAEKRAERLAAELNNPIQMQQEERDYEYWVDEIDAQLVSAADPKHAQKQANIQFERYAAIYIPGGTLALKGAIDAKSGKGPHCAPGCIFCEIDGIHLFDHWMRQGIK